MSSTANRGRYSKCKWIELRSINASWQSCSPKFRRSESTNLWTACPWICRHLFTTRGSLIKFRELYLIHRNILFVKIFLKTEDWLKHRFIQNQCKSCWNLDGFFPLADDYLNWRWRSNNSTNYPPAALNSWSLFIWSSATVDCFCWKRLKCSEWEWLSFEI